MSAIELLEERIRGLEMAFDSAGSKDERDYIRKLINEYKADLEELRRK